MREARSRAYHKCAMGGRFLPCADHSADIVNYGAYCTSHESTTHKGQQKRGVGA